MEVLEHAVAVELAMHEKLDQFVERVQHSILVVLAHVLSAGYPIVHPRISSTCSGPGQSLGS